MYTNGNGFVKVYNSGAFILVVVVAYDLNGQHVIKESPQFFARQSTTLIIPYNAINIRFQVKMNRGTQAWTNIYREKFTTVPRKCFNVANVLWHIVCYEIPCNG